MILDFPEEWQESTYVLMKSRINIATSVLADDVKKIKSTTEYIKFTNAMDFKDFEQQFNADIDNLMPVPGILDFGLPELSGLFTVKEKNFQEYVLDENKCITSIMKYNTLVKRV